MHISIHQFAVALHLYMQSLEVAKLAVAEQAQCTVAAFDRSSDNLLSARCTKTTLLSFLQHCAQTLSGYQMHDALNVSHMHKCGI